MTLHSEHQLVSRSTHKKRQIIVKRGGCANGLYLEPTSSTTTDVSQPLQIQWDPTCFTDSPKAVDIYMTAPYAANPTVYTWYGVDNSGSYSPDLKPGWWNATTSITMQLNIIESGTPSFLTNIPPGPLFTVTYNPASDTQAASDANTSSVNQSPYQVVNNWIHKTGLNGGQLAAAVLLPLLAVFGGVAYYIRWKRAKELKKRQRWSRAIDKRMSMVSQDWKSMTGAAASAVIRHSMVGSGSGDRTTKASSFFAGSGPLPGMVGGGGGGAGRSSVSIDGSGPRYGNGLGLGGNQINDSTDDMIARLRRPADAVTPNPAARVSRISFATDVHPRSSMGETRGSIYTQGTGTRTSRAFHKSWYALDDDEEVPPLPQRKPDDITMSPTQTDGPESLSPQDIRSMIGAEAEPRPSVDVGLLNMPAMTLMRTSDASNEPHIPNTPSHTIDYPVMPSPAVLSPTSADPFITSHSPSPSPSPAHGMFGGMTALRGDEAAKSMSPDAMLKAYALNRQQGTASPAPTPVTGKFASVTGLVIKKRATSNAPTTTTSSVPTTTSANGGMRVLYAPPTNLEVRESAYAEDAYDYGSGPSTDPYVHGTATDSYAPSTEEGVVTYGSRATYLGPSGPVQEDTNPFRITSTSGYSDISGASRYSSTGQEESK